MTNRLTIIAAAIAAKAAQAAQAAQARLERRPAEAGSELVGLNREVFTAEQIREDLLPRLNEALGDGVKIEVVEK